MVRDCLPLAGCITKLIRPYSAIVPKILAILRWVVGGVDRTVTMGLLELVTISGCAIALPSFCCIWSPARLGQYCAV